MKIIYEDSQILIVYKEPGLAVQTASVTAADLESSLKNYRSGKGEDSYIGVVHRLDQPVGGLLVFAKTPGAAASLGTQVQDGRMGKVYLARTQKPDAVRNGTEGTMVDYLQKDGKSNMSRVVRQGTKGARRASLRYRFISDDTALVQLETGRHHQIRVQFASRGWGLAGDMKYAAAVNETSEKAPGGKAIRGGRIFPALLAYKISLRHPSDGRLLEFKLDDQTVREMGYALPQEG